MTKSRLKNRRNQIEDELLTKLREAIDEECRVTIVADRGFGDHKLYAFLRDELKFDSIIRFRQQILVTSAAGEAHNAIDWIGPGGRMKRLKGPSVTQSMQPVPAVVCVRDAGMKDAWCLATSRADLTGTTVKKRYGRRFSIEEMFRDMKDLRYGMGMSWMTIGRADRRDRLFLIATLAHALLTLLGAAGEELGFDRYLKTNTSKKRTLSLLRQGLRGYDLLPTMAEDRLVALMREFDKLLRKQRLFREISGAI